MCLNSVDLSLPVSKYLTLNVSGTRKAEDPGPMLTLLLVAVALILFVLFVVGVKVFVRFMVVMLVVVVVAGFCIEAAVVVVV